MKPGSTIANTTSIDLGHPNPGLSAFAATGEAIQDFTGGSAAAAPASRQADTGPSDESDALTTN